MNRLAFLLLAALLSTAGAADQTGAERTKVPIDADIVDATKVEGATSERIGNVRVTYADGTKDRWTTKGNCSQPAVAADGTVGWTVNEAPKAVAASYKLRPNPTLVLCREGRILAKITAQKPFIEEWKFLSSGDRLVLKCRGAHGPADIELHATATGKLLESHAAFDEKLPAWAKPFSD